MNYVLVVVTTKGNVQRSNFSGYLGESIADREFAGAVNYRYAAIFVYADNGDLDHIRQEKFGNLI